MQRFITGNLAADPETVQAGNVQIIKFRVIENTGEYRGGKFIEHPDPTTHFIEAKFELGENIRQSLHKGASVGVLGKEHTASWGSEGDRKYGRVIDADWVGPGLDNQTVQITKNQRQQ